MKNIIIISFLFLFISSCTRESKVSTITIQLPPVEKAAADTVNLKSGAGFNNTLNPSTVADINCYGVFVGGPENFMQSSSCSDSATNTVQMRFGPKKFFMPAGSEVSIDVPSGTARKIYLVGLKSQSSACQLLSPTQNPDVNNLSVPHVIGEKVVDLVPGTTAVTLVRTLDSSRKFDSCNFGGEGGSSQALFGNGRDGNLTVTGPAFLTFGTDNFAADMDASHSLSSLPSPATKKISSSARITNIDSANGKVLTLSSAISSVDFEPGDEVLWHVSSAWAATNPDYEGCGNGTSLYRGQYGFAHIASVPNSTQVVLNSPITANPGAINNANLAQSNPQANTPFCRIHITRVPNFNIINLSSSQSLNLSTTAFNYSSGGIIAFRVNEIVLNSGAVFNINADGKGFGNAVTYQGDGVQGKGNNGGSDYVANQNGGGLGTGSNSGGGGGGSANGGSGGGGTPGQYGNGITFCENSTPCLGTQHKRIFFGGGGGSASATGGSGGGFILILARKISGTGSLVLTAKGANGSSGSAGAGGGGGGSISLNAKEISSGVTTTIFTNGGNGGTGTTAGGGGGGGSAEVRYCAALTSSPNATLTATGGTGYVAGTTASAAAQVVMDVPALCTTN